MCQNQRSSLERRENRLFVQQCILGVLMILFTRVLTLTYHMDLHPDEKVFYFGTDSLLDSLLYGTEFQQTKKYPEGAYLLHLPFQALGRFVCWLTGQEMDPRVWGRVSSACYFTGSVMIGMYLEYCYFEKNRKTAGFYLLTMCFSLFFLEHSRYGVGDMISLFLLMVVVVMTAKWCENQHSSVPILLAAFLSGALGAVKYPQLYFVLIPLATWLLTNRGRGRRRWMSVLGLLLTCILGFLAFSPKGMLDWSYFYKVVQREMNAYVFEVKGGGIHNSFAQMVLHHLFYTDFPLAFFLLAVAGIRRLGRCRTGTFQKLLTSDQPVDILLKLVLPVVTFGFFFYNLFVTNFTLRTLTPYLGLCPLYTACIVSRLYSQGSWKRVTVLLMTVFMVLRGTVMIGLLSTDHFCEEFVAEAKQVLSEQNGEGRVIALRMQYIPHRPEVFENTEVLDVNIQEFEAFNDYDFELKPGDVVISSAPDYSRYPLPVRDASVLNRYTAWKNFKHVNGDYFVYVSMPGWPYYLLGSSVIGNSFTPFTFPRLYIYYRPAEG